MLLMLIVLRTAVGSGPVRSTNTIIAGSPFFNTTDTDHVRINITPDGLEDYLKNLVISTIAINPPNDPIWTTLLPINNATDLYVFNQKTQFYAPYAACFVATLLIYGIGIYGLFQNKYSADGSFLQIIATTTASENLRSEAANCSQGGMEGFSKKLKAMELMYGMHQHSQSERRSDHDPSYTGVSRNFIYGFGTVDEVQRLA
jgi:hypothetical protein